ncbi:butyrophilin 2 [Labeo rohita]|uniref:Butyrophilin 2 n=1 Tax=Labeo rohita TaxID=84645 RepID=A0A498M6M2_LABRO|nr:butyrophilin 2 [Labeo rohita]
MITDGLIVKGPSGPLVAPLGSSVVLPCSVDELLSVEGLEVEWRRNDSDTLVHLFQDGETQTGVQQEDYQDRAYFFTEEIQRGNFSLRLDDLRSEDEGRYTCTVYIQQESGETVVEIKVDGVERLRVSGSSRSISAYVGEDVTLSCSVDSHITPEDLEVSWKKTDEDEDIVVLLYQNNEAFPEASVERYRDRVEFFTAEIPKGNFSLRLKSVRTEDKGVYMCKVSAGGLSANTTVELERLERLRVSGSSRSISAYVSEDITLSCSVNSHIPSKNLEVSWMKTDEDEDIVVLLYQNNETSPEASDERYRDRVEFFTAEIPKGNFSLRLKSVRTKDKGVYMCEVSAGGLSANTTVELERLEFKVKDSSDNQTVPLGDSVILPCQVDKSLLQKSLKVEWRRTDSETLVHLYEDGESRPKKQHKKYHQRAHFITDEIKDGNFSIRLEKVRAEDAGEYACKVYSDQDCVHSADAGVEILRFDVKCSRHTLAPLGCSVVLPCYGDRPSTTEGLRVEWRKKDLEHLVHLYEDGESRAEAQQEDYQDRAHFFTDQIQHGNFSLRLDNLRTEDEGQYTCTVYSQQRSVFSAETNLEMKLLDTVFRLQMFLVFCPNLIMFLAFVLWGVSEGSLYETIFCCSLYFLRPLMLLWTAPYVNEFTGNIKTWLMYDSYLAEYILFSAALYSVMFKSAWDKSLNYTVIEGAIVIVLFVFAILFNLICITYLLVRLIGKLNKQITATFYVLAGITFNVLPSIQFILLFFAFGSGQGGFIIVTVLPVFLTVARYNWSITCGKQMGCSPAVMRSAWFTLMILINAGIVYFYIITLENEKEFLRLVPVYLFGSVGVVLLNSVALMTELILKTVNGKGVIGDMRIIVFSSEFIFTLCLMILMIIEPCLIVKGPSGPLVAPLGSSVVLPCSVDQLLSVEDLEVEWRRTDSDTLVHLFQDERLRVSGLSRSISASVGEDVTLRCSVDSHITSEDLKVSWKKTDENIQVLLYQNNKTSPEASDERYRDRVEFFTDEIPKGNFSLRLKSVRTEDKGVYMCEVSAGGLSANTTVELERLGFSVLHIIMLILCISASGSALLLFCLIYCRSPTKDTVFRLQMFLVFFPNILMFLAFVLWGVSEGSLYETVSCCALYFLRPLMLLWTAPYVNEFPGKIKAWIKNYSYEAEYVFFSAVFYSVLIKSAWDKSLNYTGFEGVIIIILFVIVTLFSLFFIIFLLAKFTGKLSKRISAIFGVLSRISFDLLPSLQFILLFYAFGSAKGGFFVVAALPMFLTITNYHWDLTCGERMGCSLAVRRSVWFTLMILVNAGMLYFYIIALENAKGFQGVVPVYLFGSVGVVLLNSVALMTELILKTVNGKGVMGDMRIIVFSSEFIFTLFLMILMVFQPYKSQEIDSCLDVTGTETRECLSDEECFPGKDEFLRQSLF